MEPVFLVGDVVSLKSGGPDMTVREVIDDVELLVVIWFNEEERLCEAEFGFDEVEMGPRPV